MPTPTTTLTALQLVTPVLPPNTSVLSTDSSVLPFVINGDTNTTRIEIGIYNTVYGLNTYTTAPALVWSPSTTYSAGQLVTYLGAAYIAKANANANLDQSPPVSPDFWALYTGSTNQNQFTLTVPITTSIAQTNVQIVGRNYDPSATWEANFAYSTGARFADSNGNVEVVVAVTSGGTSGPTQPSWATFLPIAGTSVTVNNNVLTVAAPNVAFSSGQLVYFTNFVNATFLNGQVLTVASVTPGVGFTAPITASNYVTTVDTGTVQSATSDGAVTWANVGGIAVTPIVKFAFLYFQSDLAASIAPPSGISALKNQTDCTLRWVTPDYPGFIGVRVQISTDPAGVNPPFTQYGDLITNVTTSVPTVINTTTATSVNIPEALITGVSLSNNLLTVLAANSFVQGTVATLGGLASATFLNDETITVLSASPTFFTASFTGENYGNSITATSISGNTLTVTVSNEYVTGDQVVLNGTQEGFLNGVVLTVLTATAFHFTAKAPIVVTPYTNPADTGVATIADSGIATSIISTSTTQATNTTMTTNYSTVDIPYSIINQQVFYAMFSTVIQDPQTNIIYESVENGPLLCGFVNLKLAGPTDFPVLQRKEDIAGRLIAQINKQLPDLDLSPRSEARDLFIDPFSIEAANMSVREWFARVSTSISAISQVDDSTGNGVSDPFQSSPYKQQIARAYGLSPQDTQNLINEQFDLLGEQAGLVRLGSTASTVVLTFYTYQQPQSSIVIPEGATVSTIPSATTSSLTFQTQGQGVIDITNLASFYNSTTGWWGVSVPAQCTQPGSIGNVGAGTITQTVANTPAGINVTNLIGAQFGSDQESNSGFAARIQARLVTGIDSSSRNGYLVAALSTPGIIGAQVVAAGDLFMLRDWDPTRQKHVYGAVDIYVQGNTLSQQDNFVPFVYQNNGTYGVYTSYSSLTYLGNNTFQINNFNSLAFPPYDGVELYVSRSSGSFYLSLDRAQFFGGTIIINGNDMAYQYVGSATTYAKVPLIINTNPATNTVALGTLAGATSGTYSFQLFMREGSPLSYVPSSQPVLQVYSVTGSSTETGAIPSDDITLIHTSDFLLEGGSNAAGDTVQVSLTSTPVTNMVTVASPLTSPTLIDIGMAQTIAASGSPGNVLSVRSSDLSTLYQYGIDYTIVPYGPYLQYALQALTSSVAIKSVAILNNVLTVVCNNEFSANSVVTLSGLTNATFLNNQPVTIATATPTSFTAVFTYSNYPTPAGITATSISNNVLTVTAPNSFTVGQTVVLSGTSEAFLNNQTVTVLTASNTQFTANFSGANYTNNSDTGIAASTTPDTGIVTGSAIQPNQQLSVTYNKYVLYERLSFIANESQVLSGTLPTTLDNDGFVNNTWLPQSYTIGIPTFPVTQLGYSLILDGWDGAYNTTDGGLDIAGSLAYDPSGLVGNGVPYASRYIKVTYNNGVTNVVMKQNLDYTLTVDPVSGSATLARIVTGAIPDGATVNVSYFVTETFTISTQYPTFVQMLANTIAETKSAGASVLVKAMVANPVDITLTVTLDANTSAATVDPVIRTVINIVLDNSVGTLYQSSLIQQIQNITGVKSVEIPLIKCAKSNGSYDIGVVVPTGTPWTKLSSDPAFSGVNSSVNGVPVSIPQNSWITTAQVLSDSTIPSGGDPNAIVDFLYQGQAFERATSVSSFLTTALSVPHLAVAPGATFDSPGSFYIIGVNDPYFINNPNLTAYATAYEGKVMVTIPTDVANPGNLPYFCTYQVFDEEGASDVTVSPTEYLSPGTITINYVTPTS